jgi:hypothetical protein
LSDENIFIQVFKIVWNLINLGQNLGKILENVFIQVFKIVWNLGNLRPNLGKILEFLKLDKSSAVKLNKILGKSSNL